MRGAVVKEQPRLEGVAGPAFRRPERIGENQMADFRMTGGQ